MVIVNIIKKEDSNAFGLSDLQNCNHKIVTLYCTWKIFQGGKLSIRFSWLFTQLWIFSCKQFKGAPYGLVEWQYEYTSMLSTTKVFPWITIFLSNHESFLFKRLAVYGSSWWWFWLLFIIDPIVLLEGYNRLCKWYYYWFRLIYNNW